MAAWLNPFDMEEELILAPEDRGYDPTSMPILYDPDLNCTNPSSSLAPWTKHLIHDLALEIEATSTVLGNHNLSETDYAALLENPIFRRELAETRHLVHTSGITFKYKTKLMAEETLPRLQKILDDPDTPPSTILTTLDRLTRWGELEPKAKDENSKSSAPSVNIQINL